MSVPGLSIQRHAYRLATFSHAAGVIAISVGCLVFFGWTFDIALLKSVMPDLVTMKANTAVCFVLAGSLLLMWHGTRTTRPAALNPVIARYVALALACAVIAVAAITLSEDLFDWNAAIDQLLFRDLAGVIGTGQPGRMSSATALSFVLVGVSLVFLLFESLYAAGSVQSLAAIAIVIAFASLLGYVLHVPGLYRVRAFSSMALHTTMTFLILEMGLLATRPMRGWVKELVADTPGAQMGRRLLVSMVILLPTLGWLRLKGQEADWYGTEFGIGVLITASLILIAVLILLNTRWANPAETKIVRLNRVYAVLSRINALIVRVHDRKELFEASCQIAVDAGGFPFVWVGIVDQDAMEVRPVAWAGDERGFLDKAGERFSIRDNVGQRGPIAEAVLGSR